MAGAWVRGTVAGQTTSGAFMELKSAGGAVLVGAESPAAGAVEIHEMNMDGNVMRMRAVPRIDLPAGKSVELKPGGYHVMLMQLKQPLKVGEIAADSLARGKQGQVSDKRRCPCRGAGSVRSHQARSDPTWALAAGPRPDQLVEATRAVAVLCPGLARAEPGTRHTSTNPWLRSRRTRIHRGIEHTWVQPVPDPRPQRSLGSSGPDRS